VSGEDEYRKFKEELASLDQEFNRDIKTLPGVTIPDNIKLENRFDTAQLLKIGEWKKAGFRDFLDHNGRIFPIHPLDDFEAIVKRYFELFREEAEAFLKQIELQKKLLHKESGMSKEGNMMTVASIPSLIHCAIRCVDAEAWFKPNREKTLEKFLKIAPKFFLSCILILFSFLGCTRREWIKFAEDFQYYQQQEQYRKQQYLQKVEDYGKERLYEMRQAPTLKFNPNDSTWQYVREEERLRFNPMSGKWEWK